MIYNFTHLETESEVTLDTDKLSLIKDAIGVCYDELADMLTGYNCDSYADATEELVNECDGDMNEALEYDEETYNRVRAYHRIMNGHLSDDVCETAWKNDFASDNVDG